MHLIPAVAYLVIYHCLFVMFVWSYIVAVWTQPGYARDVRPPPQPCPLAHRELT